MILHALLFTLAAAESRYRPLPPEKAAGTQAFCAKEKQLVEKQAAEAVPNSKGTGNLPFAMGRRFRTLDEYLVHLECRAAPIDLPWWKEIRPGVYQYVTTKPGAPRQTATRAELLKRFGFPK
jgi:hypothetical protein